MKKIKYLLFPILILLMTFCRQEKNARISTNKTYLNLADDVKYIGMKTCKSCHANIHETYIHTGMGKSFDHASKEKSDAHYDEHTLVYDEKSNFYYKPFFENDSIYIMEFRLEGKDTIHKRIENITYIIGSGQHTNSHMLDIGGYIFQAPITYYTQIGKWDMAPGFEGGNERFSRIMTSECVTCHNNLPDYVEGSLNKYTKMPSGIECERCHGPGEIHVKEKLAGNIIDTAKYIDYTIVNPKDLTPALQMSLCQRCHLQGVAVLNDGKTHFDFKPGMKLSDVVNVFLPRYTDSDERFIMASQADRLRLSQCFIQSEKMTCLTCHNPHVSVEATDRNKYNASCVSCHENKNIMLCSESKLERDKESDSCVSCHMPRSASIDIPHVNITDHFISKTNIKSAKKIEVQKQKEIATFLGLKILTKEKAEPLEMAKGYIALYDKYVTNIMMLDSAKYYLDQSTASDVKKFKTLIHYYFSREDFASILRLAENENPEPIVDAWTNYRIGEAYFKHAKKTEAIHYYKSAVDMHPFNLEFEEKLGVAYLSQKNIKAAQDVFEFILSQNPKRKIALTNLGYLFALKGNYRKAENYYDKTIALDPDNEQALINKSALLLLRNDLATAKKLINRVLKINPVNQQALSTQARMNKM